MTLSARVDALIKLGLDKYGEGDLVGALSEWEHALTLDADAVQASEYIAYVRQNFDQLDRQFQQARAVADAAAAEGVPFIEAGRLDLDLDDDDDGAYEAFEVEDGARDELEQWIDSASVDEGWSLEELESAAPLPPSPGGAFGLDLESTGQRSIGVAGGELGDGAAELAADESRIGESLDLADEVDLRAPTHDIGAGPGAEEDFSGLNFLLDDSLPEPAAESAVEAAEPPQVERETLDDDDLEHTVPGGEEPPPLPDRPSLSDEAIAAFEVERELSPHARDSGGVPGVDVPSDFDLGEVGRLDGALRDDRIVEPDDVADVRVTFHDVGTSEQTMPARPSQTDFELPAELELDARAALPPLGGSEGEDPLEETVERNAAKGLWSLSLDDEGEEDDELTRERPSDALGLDELGIDLDLAPSGQRAPTMDPALEAGVVLDEAGHREAMDLEATREVRALPDDGRDFDSEEASAAGEFVATGKNKRAIITGVSERAPELDAMRMEVVAAQIDREIDAAGPVEESDDDRTRRRVAALVERAGREFEEGHYPTAVSALDLALDERPESAIAQKIVHRHRDLLFQIYEAYIGDEARTPIVALPMHEIALQELDSRAAFLLSRIDGMLTFEEILDVAGMSRMEAYRHLSRLLLRGILEVR